MSAKTGNHPLIAILVDDMAASSLLIRAGRYEDGIRLMYHSLSRLNPKDHDKITDLPVLRGDLENALKSISAFSVGLSGSVSQRNRLNASINVYDSDFYRRYTAVLWVGGYLEDKKYNFFDPAAGRKSNTRKKR